LIFAGAKTCIACISIVMSSGVETSLISIVRDSSASLGMTKAADKIIVALDVATKAEAVALVEELRGQISFFKIGLQLYTAEGPEIVRAVLAMGAEVFLDLKFNDIPTTVARTVEAASSLAVRMLTIHL